MILELQKGRVAKNFSLLKALLSSKEHMVVLNFGKNKLSEKKILSMENKTHVK